MTKATTTLERKLLFARILQWLFLALVVLPISAAILGLIYVLSLPHGHWGEAIGWGLAVHFVWPVPVFALMGFVLALEWKQGLQKRLQKQEGGAENVA